MICDMQKPAPCRGPLAQWGAGFFAAARAATEGEGFTRILRHLAGGSQAGEVFYKKDGIGPVCRFCTKTSFGMGEIIVKRWMVFVVALACSSALVGCSHQPSGPAGTLEGNIRTYSELADGTWQAEGNTYRYRLEIGGRMPHAAQDVTFVYLSNVEEITFEQAWRAAGLSSDGEDSFAAEEALLVEVKG